MTEPAETASRDKRLSPILAGVLLDLLDFATYGPIGLWAGVVVGGLAGYLLARAMGFERRWPAAVLVAGAYCMLPFTAFVPLVRLRPHGYGHGRGCRAGGTPARLLGYGL